MAIFEPTPPFIMELKASDIKQYAYCPRIVYYKYVQPLPSRPTNKMQFGQHAHRRAEELESRRSLQDFDLPCVVGRRHFRVEVQSSQGYHGVIDMVIETSEAVYPVEIKLTSEDWRQNHIDQLVAYAMALEETWQRPVQRGYLLALPSRSIKTVSITSSRKSRIIDTVERIQRLLHTEELPPYTSVRGRCVNCEYRRFCADVPFI